MYKYLLVIVVVAVLAFVACAPKEEAPSEEPSEEPLETVVYINLHDKQDASDDNIVTLEEHKIRSTGWYESFDANTDGMLDEVELKAMTVKAFDARDADDDNQISFEEMKLFIVGEGWEDIDTEGVEGVEGAKFAFPHIDVNADGEISMTEHVVFIENRHTLIDTNSDGIITMDELAKAFDDMHKEMDTDTDGLISIDEVIAYRYAE
ncbi:MAG: hypothetical protein K8R90_09025 [Candidatus Cloacimonetes bacterium]|nr:hypothetical protein [Candidatus Cloacimonadota bacterium]